MAGEFTTDQQCVITHSLAKRVDYCDAMLTEVMRSPIERFAAEQCLNASHWIRERLEAQRTLVRAREVFWS